MPLASTVPGISRRRLSSRRMSRKPSARDTAIASTSGLSGLVT
jgi:hypothetical protein